MNRMRIRRWTEFNSKKAELFCAAPYNFEQGGFG